jgi:hypothetical protein
VRGSNIYFIIQGLFKSIDKRLSLTELHKITICTQDCRHAKGNKVIAFFFKENLTGKAIEGKHCTKCGCILSLKIRSEDKCPLGKWK